MRNWGIAIAAILGVLFALLYLKGCVSDQSKPVIKEYLTTKSAKIKANQAAQDTIIAKADTLQAVSRKLPRIKDLRPIDVVIPRNSPEITQKKIKNDTSACVSEAIIPKKADTFSVKSRCDSLFKAALHKEMVLDSLFKLVNDLKFTIVKERGLQARKDSINEAEKDSLRTEANREQRKSYWRGVRHGAAIGYGAGFATSVIAR